MKQITFTFLVAATLFLAACSKEEAGVEAKVSVRGKGKFYELQYIDEDDKTRILSVDSAYSSTIRVSNKWIISATQKIDTGWVVVEANVAGVNYYDSTNGYNQIRATIFK